MTGVSDGLYLSLSGLIAEKWMKLLACFSKKSCSLCAINRPIAHLGKKSCPKSFPPRLLAEVHLQLLSGSPISAEMHSNPMSQSIILIPAARIHHTCSRSPVAHATVNNRWLAKSRRKDFEVLQHCCSPRSQIPKQRGFQGPACDPAPKEDNLRKIFAEATGLPGLFLLLFQFLAGLAAAWMPKACQSCSVVWLHWIAWEVNYILTYAHVLITATGVAWRPLLPAVSITVCK